MTLVTRSHEVSRDFAKCRFFSERHKRPFAISQTTHLLKCDNKIPKCLCLDDEVSDDEEKDMTEHAEENQPIT